MEISSFTPKYFKPEEFEKATPPCLITDMDNQFLMRLDALRAHCGFPFIINSAFRSLPYELSKHRDGLSFHTHGRAVDIRCTDAKKRAKIILYAPAFGLRGIGVSNRFVHLDDREENMIWSYD